MERNGEVIGENFGGTGFGRFLTASGGGSEDGEIIGQGLYISPCRCVSLRRLKRLKIAQGIDGEAIFFCGFFIGTPLSRQTGSERKWDAAFAKFWADGL